jgi:hypothetical protein
VIGSKGSKWVESTFFASVHVVEKVEMPVRHRLSTRTSTLRLD